MKKLSKFAILSWKDGLNTHFSDVQKYAVKDMILYIATTAVLMAGFVPINEAAMEVEIPKNREQQGPKTMLPWDIAEYIRDVYIPEEYYKLAGADLYFRIVESQITSVDPKSASDIIKSITAIASGVTDHLGILGTVADITGISGHTLDEEIKQGGYKYYTRGERSFYKLIGPLDNLHTLLSPEHIKANLRFYTNTYAWLWKAFGYDFTKPDKPKASKQGNRRGRNNRKGNSRGGNSRGGNVR